MPIFGINGGLGNFDIINHSRNVVILVKIRGESPPWVHGLREQISYQELCCKNEFLMIFEPISVVSRANFPLITLEIPRICIEMSHE